MITGIDKNGREWTFCGDVYTEPIGVTHHPRSHRRRDHVTCSLEPQHVGVHEHGPSGTRWFGRVRFPDREGGWSPPLSERSYV